MTPTLVSEYCYWLRQPVRSAANTFSRGTLFALTEWSGGGTKMKLYQFVDKKKRLLITSLDRFEKVEI